MAKNKKIKKSKKTKKYEKIKNTNNNPSPAKMIPIAVLGFFLIYGVSKDYNDFASIFRIFIAIFAIVALAAIIVRLKTKERKQVVQTSSRNVGNTQDSNSESSASKSVTEETDDNTQHFDMGNGYTLSVTIEEIKSKNGGSFSNTEKEIEYTLPEPDLLDEPAKMTRDDYQKARENASLIVRLLEESGITCNTSESVINNSLAITKLIVKRKADYKLIISGRKEIARQLGLEDIFILHINNEDNVVNIAYPLVDKNMRMKPAIQARQNGTQYDCTYCLGYDFEGNPEYGNLENERNILISGNAMTGKTSFVKSVLVSIMMTHTPKEIEFIIFDSKKLNYIEHKDNPFVSQLMEYHRKGVLESITDLINRRIRTILNNKSGSFREYNDKSSVKMKRVVVVLDEIDLLVRSNTANVDMLYDILTKGPVVGVNTIMTCNDTSKDLTFRRLFGQVGGLLMFNTNTSSNYLFGIKAEFLHDLGPVGDAIYMSELSRGCVRAIVPLLTDEESKRVCDHYKRQRDRNGV